MKTQSLTQTKSPSEELFALLDNSGFLGFNRDWTRRVASSATSRSDGYPPYNLYKKTTDSGTVQYVVDVACAGFSSDDLEVVVEKDQLMISGKKDLNSTVDKEREYITHGIAARKFSLSFILERNVHVVESKFVNGILSVVMEQIVPEEELPKRIAILTQ